MRKSMLREQIVEEVGDRIRLLRTGADLSLDDLAERSGVSRAMLSKTERGEKSPTLSILVRVARGLNVPVSKLMGAEPEVADAAVIKAGRHLTFKDPETGFERSILTPPHVDNGVEFLRQYLPPKASTGELPPYSQPAEKYLLVQEGRLTVYLGDTKYLLASGDSMYFEVRKAYRLVNEGAGRCIYLMVIIRAR